MPTKKMIKGLKTRKKMIKGLKTRKKMIKGLKTRKMIKGSGGIKKDGPELEIQKELFKCGVDLSSQDILWRPCLVPKLIKNINQKDPSFNFFHYLSRDLDKGHIYKRFEPLIERKITNECVMKDIIYIESAILRNDIVNEMEHYDEWCEVRSNYLTLSLHEDKTYVDEFHPENLHFIKKYNENQFIKVFLNKLKNIIKKRDQEVFNDTIEYYKERLEGKLNV